MFEETVRQCHERLGDPIDNCFIVNCKNKAVVPVRGIKSGKVKFYCARCAAELLTDFYNLFEVAR